MPRPAPTAAPAAPVYPFAALVGQETMKLALLLAAIDPSLGGVLILGERGTAKSTAARGLAELWPGRAGLVTLPLGATEDRVVGSLDLEAAVTSGRLVPEKGLLARADGGVLYVDEVNLLDEHLAALILDAAASGFVRLEREGVSLGYPARFVLIGTMNPEEGQVSPQLLDRFGLAVGVRGERAAAGRKELIRRRLAFEADPEGFRRCWARPQRELAERAARGRAGLSQIRISPEALALAAGLAQEAGAAGQRAELSLVKAARALAAWQGRGLAGRADVRVVAELALAHRRRQLVEATPPPERPGLREPPLAGEAQGPRTTVEPGREADPPSGRSDSGQAWGLERVHQANSSFRLISQDSTRQGGWLKSSGRRLRRETQNGSGRYVRASMERLGREIALDATLRAAAPNQPRRKRTGLSLAVVSSDIREKVKVKATGRLILFLVDASGSMNSLLRMREAKAAVLSLLEEAYRKRDRVGLVSFRGDSAQVLLPPTNSVELANRSLAELPTGGKTPLAQGLVTAHQIVERELARDPKLEPLIVILSDGKPNVPLQAGADPWEEILALCRRLARPGISHLLVDSDWGHYLSFGLCRQMAESLRASYVKLDQLRSEGLVRLISRRAPLRPGKGAS